MMLPVTPAPLRPFTNIPLLPLMRDRPLTLQLAALIVRPSMVRVPVGLISILNTASLPLLRVLALAPGWVVPSMVVAASVRVGKAVAGAIVQTPPLRPLSLLGMLK